jgi:hypothetical protein
VRAGPSTAHVEESPPGFQQTGAAGIRPEDRYPDTGRFNADALLRNPAPFTNIGIGTTNWGGLEASSEGAWRAIFEGRYKLLWNSLGQHQLFDLRTDPDELHNLAGAEPERVRDMALAITEFLDLQPRPAAQGERELVDDETRRALQSLGYLE